ncbi:hypothetical protein CHS0354_014861 [Potamilus streckersoni]|uniref:Tyrosyl-DNA phosphodiesterase 2 n=1 Tax=Potamilus streckersoni TaxID=2493646 RepID=A0AAE0RMG8_9BIVA|nr:hypothetical protein CHS0354_014861 [Potamilus streckersoni]
MSESEEDINLPSASECEARCQKFAEITGTDTALAMFFLQDRDWDLDRSLNSYFQERDGHSFSAKDVKLKPENVGADRIKKSYNSATDPEPFRIRVMSWNIDGLDPKNKRSRVEGVCDKINKEKPHVVLLQEVVMETQKILEEKCPLYDLVPGGEKEYYTAILLQRNFATVEDAIVMPFYSSMMLRNLLTVKCTVKGIKFDILTSHLESTREHGKERKNQLKIAFESVKRADADRTVIFGGDLNLRDNELSEIGGMPENVYDVWEVTGKRPEAKFTWDMARNDNMEYSSKFKPKCRFDRLYIRYSKPKALVQPVYFELVGLERLQSCQRFPSDHWGLLGHFNVLSRLPESAKK